MIDIKLSDKIYNRIKWLVQIVLPAFGGLYFGLAQIWGFPNPEAVVGSLALLTTFFGIILGFSSKTYNASSDGSIVVTTDEEGKKTFSLEFDGDPYSLDGKSRVVFNVTQPPQ